MRAIERRLAALEQGSEPPKPTAADVAATALWLWGLAGEEAPNEADLTRRAKGGSALDAAVRKALGLMPEDAVRKLAELDA